MYNEHPPQVATSRRLFSILSAVFTLTAVAGLTASAQASAVGYGGNATGGAGGQTVTATTLAQYKQFVTSSAPLIVQISGTIKGVGNSINVAPNKTIVGIGTKPTIVGDIRLFPSHNVIIQDLNITNDDTSAGPSGEDGITIKNGAHDIWVDHCTFTDCADGSIDVTLQSDNVTISWCKFQYTHDHGHDFVNLIGASDSDPDSGKLHVTVHHNWYSTLCKERMPRVRFGQVHVFNNYYGAAGSNYNVGVGNSSQILVENNYFDNQKLAWKNYSSSGHQGLIHWNSGNVFVNTSIPTWAPNSKVFSPPYSYSLDSGNSVKSAVMAGAGAH